MTTPPELDRAARFHTHLGPFLVVGLRMGAVVTRELGEEPFTIRIEAHTGKSPPYSCVLDGIQLSTPCTTGNGGLEVAGDGSIRIEAASKDGRTLEIALVDEVFDRIERECTRENQESFALEIWEMPEHELLSIVEHDA